MVDFLAGPCEDDELNLEDLTSVDEMKRLSVRGCLCNLVIVGVPMVAGTAIGAGLLGDTTVLSVVGAVGGAVMGGGVVGGALSAMYNIYYHRKLYDSL